MERLIGGYRRFRAETWPREKARFEELAAQGQRPQTMVIACSDSRVDPQMIFSAGPGELFVVRNVANLVPPYMPDAAFHGTSAAVEFAVRVLGVRALVVMGHALCGGVKALIEGVPPAAGDFVAGWISIAEGARRVALACDDPEARQEVGEQEAVRISLANLMTFPWVAEAVAAGRLTLHGAHFGVATGRLVLLQPDGRFAPPER
ncbi:carbonic anhydrase [Roseicella frigidaeris]|uniref:Carbonic anhydrase n=1 Tax=Roseicella frigidaeris TaxID=2230885 RepID=A0A327M3J8_9PROT|nr:carbonic anhydrase [Roseicella frigidaeris]RAI57319.1 carbonic anhydrase [Roseicella frigidaeris]